MAGKLAQKKSRKKTRKIRVGDRGMLVVGSRRLPVEVLEDRGFIGYRGRQLLRIRDLGVSPEMSLPYEVPAEEIEFDGR